MLYLLLLLFAVPAAHAEICEDFGFKSFPNFPNVCKTDEYREKAAEKKERCTYKENSLDCSKLFTKKSRTCRKKCVDEDKVIDGYVYYSLVVNPCNNNTGLNEQSDISNFVCRDNDVGFLCKRHESDNTKFYCKCKDPKDGIFSDRCVYTTNEEATANALGILTFIVIGFHFFYVRWNRKKNKVSEDTDRIIRAVFHVFTVALSLGLIFYTLAQLVNDKFSVLLGLWLVVAIAVFVAELYYICYKRRKPSAEQKPKIPVVQGTIIPLFKQYRDNRFNVI